LGSDTDSLQYGPIGGLAFVVIVFIWWRFF
jgi:hypothetical protein